MVKIFVFLLAIAFAPLGSSKTQQRLSPMIFFVYSPYYDRLCAASLDGKKAQSGWDTTKLKPEWVTEIKGRVAEFQTQWESVSEKLFGSLFKNFNKGLSRKELTAVLSVCDQGTNMSDPLVFNVRKLLNSFPQKQPVELSFLTDIVFHELLHLWLNENFLSKGPQRIEITKNKSEHMYQHMYLYAVQDLVYQEAGLKSLWLNIQKRLQERDDIWYQALKEVQKNENKQLLINHLKQSVIPKKN
ncbi:MAG: hypothetical protein ACK5P7_02785 [Bdellovibrio sp.]